VGAYEGVMRRHLVTNQVQNDDEEYVRPLELEAPLEVALLLAIAITTASPTFLCVL
jgi:hypothetical protein